MQSRPLSYSPNTGWAKLYRNTGLHKFQDGVSRDGITCFGWDHSAVPGFPTERFLSDSSGRNMAMYIDDTVICGDVVWSDLIFDNGPHSTDAGIELVDGVVVPVYNMDMSRPECAAWEEATGLPVAPPCSTTRSGTCP